MGDRTYGTYTIPLWATPIVDADDDYTSEDAWEDMNEKTKTYAYQDLNYGDYDDLETLLESLEIPYDHSWEHGSGFDAGTKHTRALPQGGMTSYEEGGTEGLVDAAAMLALLDAQGVEALRQALTTEAQNKPPHRPLSLEKTDPDRLMYLSITHENEDAFKVAIALGGKLEYKTNGTTSLKLALGSPVDAIRAFAETHSIKKTAKPARKKKDEKTHGL